LYSEIAYRLKFKNGFMLSPLLAGGGYLMSISDIGSYLWDEELKKYEKEGFPVKHNWMISLGASAGFEPQWKILNNKRVSLFVDYRILVQGVFVRETVPVIAYAPVRIGFSFPID
jgi:hypothetical protein